MELSYKLVTKSNLKIIGTSGMYPEKDNCYKVNVTTSISEYTIEYCPKPFYHMWLVLTEVKDLVSKDTLNELITCFNQFGNFKYNKGSNDAEMNNAGDDL